MKKLIVWAFVILILSLIVLANTVTVTKNGFYNGSGNLYGNVSGMSNLNYINTTTGATITQLNFTYDTIRLFSNWTEYTSNSTVQAITKEGNYIYTLEGTTTSFIYIRNATTYAQISRGDVNLGSVSALAFRDVMVNGDLLFSYLSSTTAILRTFNISTKVPVSINNFTIGGGILRSKMFYLPSSKHIAVANRTAIITLNYANPKAPTRTSYVKYCGTAAVMAGNEPFIVDEKEIGYFLCVNTTAGASRTLFIVNLTGGTQTTIGTVTNISVDLGNNYYFFITKDNSTLVLDRPGTTNNVYGWDITSLTSPNYLGSISIPIVTGVNPYYVGHPKHLGDYFYTGLNQGGTVTTIFNKGMKINKTNIQTNNLIPELLFAQYLFSATTYPSAWIDDDIYISGGTNLRVWNLSNLGKLNIDYGNDGAVDSQLDRYSGNMTLNNLAVINTYITTNCPTSPCYIPFNISLSGNISDYNISYTYTYENATPPADTCTPPAINNDWNVLWSDNCTSGNTNLGTGGLIISGGGGTFTVNGNFSIKKSIFTCTGMCRFIILPFPMMRFVLQ
jgi:hypothetical protein